MTRPRSVMIALLFGLAVCAVPLTSAADLERDRQATFTLFSVGFPIGVLLMALYWHPYRILGFATLGSTAWFIALLFAYWGGVWASLFLGVTSGIALMALGKHAAANQSRIWIFGGFVGLAMAYLIVDGNRLSRPIMNRNAGIASLVVGILTLGAWLRLFRPFFELLVEPPLWWMFCIRQAGPGFREFPMSGPCLVIANHACWFDPIILAKVLPRPLTPMMTGRFYDLPIISWLMRRFGIIKVREQSMRRELPELKEAIAALDRGECVVVFPEGYLRRRDDQPLKRFGRGVWEILKARPATPVFACWIEGNWGSYTSYFNGKPTKNKPRDWRRPVSVSMNVPEVLDAAIHEHHLRTRIHLMNAVLEARHHLDLPEIPAFELPTREEEDRETECDQS